MTRTVRAAAAALLALSAACSTVPKTAAIQEVAIGGGFVATGTVTTVVAVVGGGLGVVNAQTADIPALCGPLCQDQARGEAVQGVLLYAGIAAAVGLAEIGLGSWLMYQGGKVIDDAERVVTENDAARSDRVREMTRPKPKPVRTAPTTPMWGPTPEPSEASEESP